MTRTTMFRERPTDVGNARRLVRLHGEDLRHVHAWGWLTWDGRRWLRDQTGAVERRAKDTVQAIYHEAARAKNQEQRERLAKHAVASERRGAISNMVALASSELEVVAHPGDFDADPWLLNVANGTLDLQTGTLRPHARTDYITKLVDVAYDPEAKAPRFRRFLEEILGGDETLITYMQRAIGYSLTGETREQCFFHLHGTGQNGKGALIRTLERLLGDYFRKADFSTFLERTSDNVRDDVARLAGARLVAAEEDRGMSRRLAEGLVKTLTGQDTIAARYLYENTFEFRPQFKLWLASNHLPSIAGTDVGIWRRIRLIPFTVHVDRPDKALEATLQGPELPGILRWAVEGCLDWGCSGLPVPPRIRGATEAYRAEQDVVGSFIEDCFVRDPASKSDMSQVRARYFTWCREQGLPEREWLSGNALGRALFQRGFESDRDSHRTTWRYGIRFREPVPSDVDTSTHSTRNGAKSSYRALSESYLEKTSNTSNASNGVQPELDDGLEEQITRDAMREGA